jgi:hypothetical protein
MVDEGQTHFPLRHCGIVNKVQCVLFGLTLHLPRLVIRALAVGHAAGQAER